MVADAFAQAPSLSVTATCLGQDAYRIDCRVSALTWEGPIPEPGGDVTTSICLFGLRGPIGTPRSVQWDADHTLLEAESGSLVWGALWQAPVLVAQFECTRAPGRLEFEFDCTLEHFHHYEEGWDRWALLGADRVQGRLTAELTGVAGTTAIVREIPLALHPGSWSAVKALYR